MNSKKLSYLFLVAAVALMVSACGPSEEETYANAVQPQLEKIGTAYGEVGTLFDAVGNDETLWDDPEWKGDLKAKADIVRQSHDAISALTPPDSLKDVHAQLTSATQDCADAMDNMYAAADVKDFDGVLESLTLMESCSSKLTTLTEQL